MHLVKLKDFEIKNLGAIQNRRHMAQRNVPLGLTNHCFIYTAQNIRYLMMYSNKSTITLKTPENKIKAKYKSSGPHRSTPAGASLFNYEFLN